MENQVLVAQSCHLHNRQTKPANGKPSRQLGFTLVELSIVLVIIGLLIGGILVGQSMIESAKVSSVIREAQQYQAAVRLFENQYRSLPGDSNLSASFGAEASGNNNGVIECANLPGLTTESINAFYVLSAAGFISTKLVAPGHYSDAAAVNSNVLGSKALKDDLFWSMSSIGTSSGASYWHRSCNYTIFGMDSGDKIGSNLLVLTRAYNKDPVINRDIYGVEPLTGLAIDKKIDDGIAGSGDVQMGQGLHGASQQICVDIAGGDYRTSTYKTTKPTFEPELGCSVVFKLKY